MACQNIAQNQAVAFIPRTGIGQQACKVALLDPDADTLGFHHCLMAENWHKRCLKAVVNTKQIIWHRERELCEDLALLAADLAALAQADEPGRQIPVRYGRVPRPELPRPPAARGHWTGCSKIHAVSFFGFAACYEGTLAFYLELSRFHTITACFFDKHQR